MKKVMKWVAVICLTPVLLILLLMVLLYLPPVQNWAVKKVANYASEKTGMDISVGHVSLKFPLDLAIDDLKAIKDNDSIPGLRDTIADVKTLYVDVQLKPLFHKQVEIDALGFRNLKLNTNGFIDDIRIKGNVEYLDLNCHGADLNKGLADVQKVKLDSANLEICLADTVPPDTTKTETNWKINVADAALARTRVKVRLPGDTMQVEAYLAKADLKNTVADIKNNLFTVGDVALENLVAGVKLPARTEADVNLLQLRVEQVSADTENGTYKVGKVHLEDGKANYNVAGKPSVKGIDANHLAVSNLNIDAENVYYSNDGLMLDINSCSLKEKSGLNVEKLNGQLALDSTSVHLPDFYMQTPDSRLKAKVDMDLNTFDDRKPGKFQADIDGYFGKQDLMRVMGGAPDNFKKRWPNQPLTIKAKAKGNMQRVDFKGLYVSLPTALQFNADGYVANIKDFDHMKADVKLKGKTGDLSFVTAMLDKSVTDKVNIPNGIAIDGNFRANGHNYGADFTAQEGGGNIKANVAVNTDVMKYSATIDADRFPLQHFVKNMGLSPLTAHIEADGQGTDFMSPSTTLRAKANIKKFHYDQYDLDGMVAEGTLANGRLHANIDSHNPLLNGQISFNAMMNTKRLQGTFACDLKTADLYSLKILGTPATFAGCAHLDIDTDLKEYYKVIGSVGDMTVMYNNTLFKPDFLNIDLLTKPDTTYARVDCGDFHLDMNGRGGYKKMLSQTERFTDELTKQLKDKHFDQITLRKKLPDARVYLSTGKDNFFVNLIEEKGISFDNLLVDFSSSHVDGLNGIVTAERLLIDSIQLDTVNFYVNTDSTGFKYNGQVRNGPDNPQYTFNALFDGSIIEKGATVNAKLYDKDDKLGLDIGAQASIENQGVMVNLVNTNPIIGYLQFHANEDNYIFMGDDKRLSANLKLKSDEGTSIHVFTNDDNTEALQDLTLSLAKVDLNQIISMLPYMPQISGIADGDFHLVQTTEHLSVSSSLQVDRLNYQGMNMGKIGTEFVYLPNSDGSHHVDGILLCEDEEVGTLVGTYKPQDGGSLDATLHMNQMPLELANGFIPNQIIGFKGKAEGDLSIKGPLSKPDVNGELYLEDTYILSMPYGVEVRVADDPVRIVGSNLLFENFEVFDSKNTPLNITGYFDFSDLNNMNLNLRMTARNFLVINAKENVKSEAFGKAYINFFGMMRGPLEALSMRGRVDVLGSTDMTYVMKDSPLTADTRLDELVKFVDFNDSIVQTVKRPVLSGFSMDMTVSFDESARIKCDLNSDHSNYIDLMGGGELRMRYNNIDNLRLNGKYTLSNAEMKYSLPIIPLKTFTIQEGSYIEFRGEPMNPTLHITATESRKATVEDEGGGTRSVDFNCGVVISQTLNDMGLEFIISAPDDVAINSELAAMTTEERGKVAVTMLTTGMYLADGNTSGFTMNGALSSFLQNEINNITGNALRTLDLSVGVDNATDASGAMHTDYSFKFAKRFWNNRLRIVIGGKVTTGADAQNQSQSFFTNVAAEYRLSPTSNKYLKLYYDRDSYDWLEGEIGEYGGGFIWRRKLQHFSDIFRFNTDNNNSMPPMQRNLQKGDSITNDSTKTHQHEQNGK